MAKKRKENDFLEKMQNADRQAAGAEVPEPKKTRRKPIAGKLIVVLLAALAVVFMLAVGRTALLPTRLLVMAGAALLVLVLLIAVLIWNTRNRTVFWIGTVLAFLLAALITLGLSAVSSAYAALTSIATKPTIEVTHISVYVLDEDPAQSLEEIRGYTFGVVDTFDKESVDTSIADINSQLGTQIAVQEFEGLTDLADALLEKRVGAALLDEAYLDLLADVEGYEEISSQLREITSLRIEKEIQPPVQTPEIPEEQGSSITIYISGIDSRGGLLAKSRSDVNIIATINPETRQVLLVSTPRDFFVPLSFNGEMDKLTHTGIYGVDCSIDTLAQFYDININYYFKVNFIGFEKIIDSLGGVDVNSDYTFSSYGTHHYFVKGENHLNGEQALAFARERMAFATGDRQRGKNQMEVIRAVIGKLQSPEVLMNYSELIKAVEGCFETSVPYDLIAELVRGQLESGGEWNVVTYSANGMGAGKKTYSQKAYAYVMIPDETTVETAKELMRQVRDGEIIQLPQT